MKLFRQRLQQRVRRRGEYLICVLLKVIVVEKIVSIKGYFYTVLITTTVTQTSQQQAQICQTQLPHPVLFNFLPTIITTRRPCNYLIWKRELHYLLQGVNILCSNNLLKILLLARPYLAVHVGGIRLCLWTADINVPIVHPSHDIYEYGAPVKWYWQENRRTWRKPCPSATCPAHIPHGLTVLPRWEAGD
jgi:hypothetical protein